MNMPEPLVSFSPGEAPVALGADSEGPYWLARSAHAIGLLGFRDGEVNLLASYPLDAGKKVPAGLVAGSRQVVYVHDRNITVGGRVASGLPASGGWEGAAAAALGPVNAGTGILPVAIRGELAEGTGFEYLASSGTNAPLSIRTAPSFAGVVSVAGSGRIGFVKRGTGAHAGITVETASAPEVAGGAWAVDRMLFRDIGAGKFFGDPSACISADGVVSWCAALWRRHRIGPGSPVDWSEQLPGTYLNGEHITDGAVDAVSPGHGTRRITIPACAATAKGILLAWQSAMPAGKDPGTVTVGLVRKGAIVAGSERTLPGFQPLLAHGASGTYLGTSVGIWKGPA